jgi:hypothetical protein
VQVLAMFRNVPSTYKRCQCDVFSGEKRLATFLRS